jgi:protease-4
LISLSGDRIFTNPATLTGSVGVLLPLVDVTALADKIGIKEDSFTSGDLKEATSPMAKRDAHARAYLQELVHRMNQVFYSIVKSRRPGLSATTLQTISDGRALAGIQAVEMKLVDQLGGEAEAQKWLSDKVGSKTKDNKLLELRDYDLTEKKGWLDEAVGGQLHLSGPLGSLVGKLAGVPVAPQGVWAIAR